MSEPKNKRGRSKQDYATPWDFIAAVENRFGKLAIDLAADATNSKAPIFISAEQDSLQQDWFHAIPTGGIGWLNPPFGNIEPWAKKCAVHSVARTILMLTPASIGSLWFSKHIHGTAFVLALQPRITFVGEKDPFTKDCILSVFGSSYRPGFDVWRWTDSIPSDNTAPHETGEHPTENLEVHLQENCHGRDPRTDESTAAGDC